MVPILYALNIFQYIFSIALFVILLEKINNIHRVFVCTYFLSIRASVNIKMDSLKRMNATETNKRNEKKYICIFSFPFHIFCFIFYSILSSQKTKKSNWDMLFLIRRSFRAFSLLQRTEYTFSSQYMLFHYPFFSYFFFLISDPHHAVYALLLHLLLWSVIFLACSEKKKW